MYNVTVPQFIKMLSNTSNFFAKISQHAEAKKYDPNVLLTARLSPDQYPFVKQMQIACDFAKGTTARLAGKEAPKFEDNEATLAQLKTRVDKTITYLKTFKSTDFQGAEERKVDIFYMPGKSLPGFEYFYEFALPNFYFHLTTAYSILRNNGVDVGKNDFVGPCNFRG